MRPTPLALAAAFVLAGCKMPATPAGYQLSCAEDGECPGGTVCSMTCCVKPGEQPTCVTAVGVGTSCTGGCAGGACTGSCPSDLKCFDELDEGLAGGLCSLDCSAATCPAVSVEGFGQERTMDCVDLGALALSAPKLCLRRCSAEPDHSGDCRPGWACDCGQGDAGACHCLPRCSAADGGTACGKAPDGGLLACEAATGLCRAPQPGPDAGDVPDGGEPADAGDVPDAAGFDAGLPWSGCLGPGYYSSCADYCSRTSRTCVEACVAPGDEPTTYRGTTTYDNTTVTPCTAPLGSSGDCNFSFYQGAAFSCCCQ